MTITNFASMSAPDKILLIMGIVLFLILAVALVVLLAKGRNITPLLAFFIFPIGMIAFSEIIVLKGPWGEIDKNVSAHYAKDPTDPSAVKAYRTELTRLDDARARHANAPLPPQTEANLKSTVSALNGRSNLTPESRVALSHAQLLLGETNAGLSNLRLAVKENPTLRQTIDPRLQALVK